MSLNPAHFPFKRNTFTPRRIMGKKKKKITEIGWAGKKVKIKIHVYTFIWAPNTQTEDMFINTVCFRSNDTLNGGRFGLMQINQQI